MLCLATCFQCDRLAADMAFELKSRGVTSVSLWPGAVQTELVSQYILEDKTPEGTNFKVNFPPRVVFFLGGGVCFWVVLFC